MAQITVVVPEDKKGNVKDIVRHKLEIQTMLGEMMLAFEQGKARAMNQMQHNQMAMQSLLSEIAKSAGHDMRKGNWSFDMATMTIIMEQPDAPLVQPVIDPGANGPLVGPDGKPLS